MRCLPLLLCLTLTPALLPAQSGWSVPVLETNLNSTAADTGVYLAVDGLTLYFASFRSGNWDLYSATRGGPGAPWSVPVPETALNDPSGIEDQPFLSADLLTIYFSSSRPGGAGSSDIMQATRPGPGLPWNTPTFVTEVNSSGLDSSPSVTADGLEMYFLTTGWGAPYAPQNAIYRATRPSPLLPFGTPTVVTELLTPNTHRDCEVAPDGLSIVYTEFISPRTRVFMATRTSRSVPFDPPVALPEFDTVGTSIGVYSFTRSPVGDEALLAAGFAAAAGGQEIMSTRFEGLSRGGIAGAGSAMSFLYRDSALPGRFYMLGAALGNTGFALGTRIVPLDPDWLLQGTLGVNVPGFTAGWAGFLDGNGESFASLANPVPAFAGLQFYVGGLTLDATGPFGVATISNVVRVELH